MEHAAVSGQQRQKDLACHSSSLAAAVWQKKRNHLGLALNGLKGLKGLKRLEGAFGSFGPVEKERLGLPQPRVVHQKRNHLACHSLKFGSSKSRCGTFREFERFAGCGWSMRQFRAS